MRTQTELTDDDDVGFQPGADEDAWTVKADGPTSRFPVLARFGIVVAGCVLTLILLLLVAPMLLPASMTINAAERVIRDLTGLEVSIQGDHSFRILPSMRLIVENISGTSADQATVQASAARLELELSTLGILTGSVDVESIYLQSPDVRVQIGHSMANDAEMGSDFNRNWGWWRDMSLQSLRIENAGVQFERAGGGQQITLENFTLTDVTPGGDEAVDAIAFEGAGMLNGQSVSVRASGADPQLLVSGNRWPVRASARAALFSADFEGALSLRQSLLGEGDLRIDADDMSALNAWLGPMLPARSGSALKFTTKISVIEGGAELSALQLNVGETQLAGDVQITRDDQGAAIIDGRIRAQTLDLGGIADDSANSDRQPAWITAGIPAGRMELSWRRLLWRDVEIGSGNAVLSRISGTNRMELLLNESVAYGGVLRGNVILDNSEGMRALNGTLRAIDVELGPFLAVGSADSLPPLSGQASLEVKLFSVGGNEHELMQALTGNAELIVRSGVLTMPDLVVGLAPEQGEMIAFQTLDGRFRIAQGIAVSDDLILRAPGLSLVGKGQVDLADWTVDVNIGRLGGDGGPLKRFRVSGPALQVTVEAIN